MKADAISTRRTLNADDGRLTIRGQSLFYRRLRPHPSQPASGPTLVFLHEALGCTAMWHGFPAQLVLDTGLPAVIYDRAGYGRSSRLPPGPKDKTYLHVEAQQVLPKLLDQLQIDRAVLLGHSDGGSIALLTAAARPERIAGIVTEAAHVFVEAITRQGIREAIAAYEPRRLEQRLMPYHGEKTRELFFSWADTWLAPGFGDWNIETCLGRIQCPALVIQGREDQYGSERQVRAIVSGIGSRATPLMMSGCGHVPHREAPKRVREAIVEFSATLH